MGQRLNIEIHRGERVLANAYYHWSAYTQSALELIQEVIGALDEMIDNGEVITNDPVLEAVRLLEATGAGMNPEEKERVGQIRDASIFKNSRDRNSGLLSITQEGIERTRLWQEGQVIIDLDSQTVHFGLCYEDDLDYYEEDEEEYEEMKAKFESYTQYDINLACFSFDDLYEVSTMVDEILDGNQYGYRLNEDTVIALIA